MIYRYARSVGAGMLALLAVATLPAQGGSATNTYDSLGRLSKVTFSNGTVVTYTYDATGNRTTVVTTGAPS